MLGLTLAAAAAGVNAQPPATPKADVQNPAMVKPAMPAPEPQGAMINRAQSLATVPLTIGAKKLVAEVATTPSQRQIGLMYRFSLAPDHGMVFVFPGSEPLGFWMRNTYIPLSVAYLDANGVILNIEDMAPQDDSTHWSRGAAQYALEMRKGWFGEHGIHAGDRVLGLPKPGRQ
jgi:hypothetical protein